MKHTHKVVAWFDLVIGLLAPVLFFMWWAPANSSCGGDMGCLYYPAVLLMGFPFVLGFTILGIISFRQLMTKNSYNCSLAQKAAIIVLFYAIFLEFSFPFFIALLSCATLLLWKPALKKKALVGALVLAALPMYPVDRLIVEILSLIFKTPIYELTFLRYPTTILSFIVSALLWYPVAGYFFEEKKQHLHRLVQILTVGIVVAAIVKNLSMVGLRLLPTIGTNAVLAGITYFLLRKHFK